MHFSFTNNICTFEYNHLIELGVEGWKVTSYENNEDLTIFKGKISIHHMDMMGYVIHILHTYFIFISWNYFFLECINDVLPFLWSFNQNGFPLKEKETASHQESEQVFEEEKWEDEAQLELSRAFSTLDSKRQNLLEKVRWNFHFFSYLFEWCCCWNVC